ncbi:MAG: toll/interleukin-1 receptor domain-containing protein [Clostridia bacterium]|nr:toll/interleukin-1 receptor domain-containing protein [Clostridia bacterium]
MLNNLTFITRKDTETGEPVLPDGKRKVFVSYRHSDEELLPLCQALATHILSELDVAIWQDSGLTAGKKYDEEIAWAITNADALILLLTPNILQSKYVLETEIPLAINKRVPIIPVIAGISKSDIPIIEELVGRIHMPVWFYGEQKALPEFPSDARKQLIDGLKLTLADKDLFAQAQLFYNKGLHSLSLRNLTTEQAFIKAYGSFFGMDESQDKELGERLMQSIIRMYDVDEDFSRLQEEVTYELLKHYYITGQPEAFLPQMKYAFAKNHKKVLSLLFDAYRTQWYSNVLAHESELSILLLKTLYKNNFGKEWDSEEIFKNAEWSTIEVSDAPLSDEKKIGEVSFLGHTAYFQRLSGCEIGLIADGYCIGKFDVYASCGDVYTLFMAYDYTEEALIVLHADFDHYGPETATTCKVYRFDGDRIQAFSFISEWQRGLKRLPYDPYTFKS